MSTKINRRGSARFRHACAWLLTSLLVSLSFSLPAIAQIAGGTISGVVTDGSSAVIPAAAVVIEHQDTGVSRTVTSNEHGRYSAPNLASGRYAVTVTHDGFATTVRRNVLVAVGQEVVVPMRLETGAVTEATEVMVRQSAVAVTSSMLSSVVDGQTVRDLPINGRDWTMLATLEPGVHTVEAQAAITVGSPNRGNRGWGTQMTFGGNRPQQNSFRLDGININDYSGGGPGSVLGSALGVDAIEEFSVVTGNASAEYGRTAGGVVNALTRSGQNTLHGSVFEFMRHDALDARNFFDGARKPPFERHQFGGAFGGPIRQDRAFFFVSYEGLRQTLGTTTVNTVPSRAAHNGQLASGRITIDPKIAPLLDLFPLPNGAENGDVGIYSFVSEATTDDDLVTGRVDHRLSTANSLRGTFMTDDSQTTSPDSYNFVLLGQESKRRMVSVEDTHVFGASLVNIARAGYSHTASLAPISVEAVDPRGGDTSLGFVPGRAVGGIAISGIAPFLGGLDNTQTNHRYHSFQFYDDVVYTRNAHAFKFGVALEHIQANFSSSSDSNGRFIFGSLDAFLANRPQSFNASLPGANPTLYLRQTVVGAYAQDDYRIRPNLTLNLGLRYEMATVPTEKYDRLTNLVDLKSTQARLGSPYYDNPTLFNFSPRLGFVWDPFKNGKTAVRGGYGLYDSLPLTYQFELLALNAAPFYRSGSVTTLPQGAVPAGGFAALTEDALRYSHVQPDPERSYVEHWNVNVQRELPASVVVQLGYVGQRGVHQPFRAGDANVVVPAETEQGLTWPTPRASGTRLNTGVGIINTLAWVSSSSYHAMNLQVSRTRARQRVGLSYTWSKSIDTSSSTIASDYNNSIQSPLLFFPEALRGLSDFDKRHNLVINYLWQVPGSGSNGAIARLVTNGWQIGGIFRAATGLPFSALIGGDALGQRNSNPFQFPDRLATPECENPVNPGMPERYIKTECFVAPQPATRLGNSGRNTLTGPGLATLDVSLFKNTYVRRDDRLNIQFRAEAFNVLNRANFSVPDRTVAQVFNQNLAALPNAGRLNSTATTSRQIQFALKFIW